MKYILPFRLHFYSFRNIYLAYWLFIALIIGAYVVLFGANHLHVLVFFVSTACIASFAIGIYEYQIVRFSYLSLKVNRPNFFISSLIFGFVHSAIIVTTYALLAWIWQKVFDCPCMPFDNPMLLSLFFLVSFGLYQLGNGYSLVLGKIKWLRHVLLLLIALMLILFGSNLLNAILTLIDAVFSNPNAYFTALMLVGGVAMLSLIANYLRFNVFY